MKYRALLLRFLRGYLLPLIQEAAGILNDALKTLAVVLQSRERGTYNADFTASVTLLSESNTGFCLDGRRSLSEELSHRNVMVVGSTGFGKSTVVAVPSILKTNASFIANDPSGELYTITASYLFSQGYDVRTVNFAEPEKSSGYNPLARIESASDANKIASMLVRSVLKDSGEMFWKLQSCTLLTLLIQILQQEESCYRNFANVRHLLQVISTNPQGMDKLVAKTNSSQIIAEYKQFLTYDYKVQSGIIATCLAALQIFTDTAVAQVTCQDTISIEQLRKHKTAIFIHSSTSDMKYYSTLISIMFEQITTTIMSRLPDKSDLSVFFILDELSSLYLPTLQIAASNVRKYRAGLLLLLQTFQQLIDVYGVQEAQSIRANCYGQLFFGGQGHQTASELSQVLGKYEYQDANGIRRVRELLTSDEIRQLNSDRALLICSNLPPMLLKLTPYYQNPFLKLKTQLPPLSMKGQLADKEVQLLEV